MVQGSLDIIGLLKYTKAADMWPVGWFSGNVQKATFSVTLILSQIEKIIELLRRTTKEDIESMESVMAKEWINQINMGKKKLFLTGFGGIDSDARDLLTRLLAFNPKERLKAEEAL